MKRFLLVGLLMVPVGCAPPPNHFLGTWALSDAMGNKYVPYNQCTFEPTVVMCEGGPTNKFGGAYDLKSATEAVAPTVGFDFALQSDGSVLFNNTSLTIRMHRTGING